MTDNTKAPDTPPTADLSGHPDDEILRVAYSAYRDHPIVMELAKRFEQANERIEILLTT